MQQLGTPMSLQEAQQRLDANAAQEQQQGGGGGGRVDLLRLDQELEDAYHTHQQTQHTHTLFKE